MSRTLALAMTKPHERMGLQQPLGRRLPHGLLGWNMLVFAVITAFVIAYVVQVNRAAARGFHLRDVEKKVDSLSTEVLQLEDKVAKLSSVQAMSENAVNLGFVPVDRLEFVNPAAGAYAMAK
ncbi:hypothetical protein KKD88_01665 [Patescibacteria group bacterium]|nr:hypothetical protein [Patescibacteria group bacterium]MBU1629762.1 hypothetical protein [Patescibacteria group bacterium]